MIRFTVYDPKMSVSVKPVLFLFKQVSLTVKGEYTFKSWFWKMRFIIAF